MSKTTFPKYPAVNIREWDGWGIFKSINLL